MTPTLRKSAVIRANGETVLASDGGFVYEVEILNELNQVIYKEIVYPDNAVQTSYGWYRSTVTLINDKSKKIRARVKLINYITLQLNFGGFLQPRKLLQFGDVAIGTTLLKTRCNAGPPPPPTGKANLTITGLTINNDGKTYDFFKVDQPKLVKNKASNFKVTFTNNGGQNASSCMYRVYLSTASNLFPNYQGQTYDLISSGDVGAIPLNSTKEYTINYTITTYEQTSFIDGGTYYLWFEVDPTNRVDESNETSIDNLLRVDFIYKSKSGKILNPIGDCPDCLSYPLARENQDGLFEENNTPYLIEVFDFYGRKITSGNVISVEEENQIINKLPKQLYIIKSKNGDRKVYY